MKILAISDTHGESDFSYLHPLAEKADLIVHAGDIADFGEYLEEALEGLAKLQEETGKTVIIVRGNHEGADLEAIAEKLGLTALHNAWRISSDHAIFGYKGGGFAVEEPRLEKHMHTAQLVPDIKGKMQIWIFHGPPRDLEVDFIPDWGSTGSQTKTDLINKYKPTLVISGHIHDSHGVVHVHDGVTLINVGPQGRLLHVHNNSVDLLE